MTGEQVDTAVCERDGWSLHDGECPNPECWGHYECGDGEVDEG